jgi:hypothetical protein
MNGKIKKCFDRLKKLGCPVKEWHNEERGHFWIDAEEEYAELWLHYDSLAFGSDRLNKILDEYGLYWEWDNCAVGCVFDN